MHDKSHELAGESRREFLKKAGAVAWVVPTMQIVNMAAASAQTSGSIVTTTKPGSTTTTTTTSKPPCIDTLCRIKANYEGGWQWDTGQGANDCLTGDWGGCDVRDIGASITGDDKQATVRVSPNCTILSAKHKGGQICVDAVVDGNSATFTAVGHGISHVELVVECDCD